MPKGVYKHPASCGFQKGHKDYNSTESHKRTGEKIKGANNPFYGKNHPPELWEKIKKKLKGRKVWNKGLTKEKDDRIAQPWLGKKRYCMTGENNPNYEKDYSREKHPRWIEDRTKLKHAIGSEERRSSIYKDWRRRVLNRDKHKCKINNQNCSGRTEVHHILGFTEYPELRYEINNGITLCHAHHPRTRAEEKQSISVFTNMVVIQKN